MKNLILNQNYGKLYEDVYKGKCEVFEFQNSLGSVKHLFIKREVPNPLEGVIYYDLITPFTYGGPVIEGCKEEDKWDLINDFQNEFMMYCKENNIVSEFIRFHPLLFNSMDFLHCYELDYVEDSRGIDISRHSNPVAEGFSVDSIEKVLEAFKQGLSYEIFLDEDKSEDFNLFLKSIGNHSSCHSSKFFEGCKQIIEDHLVFVEVRLNEEVVGMGMGYIFDKILTTHIFITNELGENLNAAFVMHYGLAVWSKSNGIETIHLAGTWFNKSEDENAAFKENFDVLSDYKYCIGRKIWNETVYEKLCDRAEIEKYIDYFPAYRSQERNTTELKF
ncbi:hypothetical protein [Planomicrobium okeanokoites]|uniref:hypothetical protein n=1 Tax=Planomicrobium okeanokoites TaxID=244 RepID=UPI0030FC4127